MPDAISPKAATEIRPVSSETTIDRQSVSSVMPIAARWRVPSVRESEGLVMKDVLRLQPTHSRAQEALGDAYAKLGRKDEAIIAYREAMKDVSRAEPALNHRFRPMRARVRRISDWNKTMMARPR